MIELKFFSNESTYCKKEYRILFELLKLYPDLKLSKFTEDSEEANKYKIKGVPTVIIEKDDQYIEKVVGGGPISFYTKIIKEIYE